MRRKHLAGTVATACSSRRSTTYVLTLAPKRRASVAAVRSLASSGSSGARSLTGGNKAVGTPDAGGRPGDQRNVASQVVRRGLLLHRLAPSRSSLKRALRSRSMALEGKNGLNSVYTSSCRPIRIRLGGRSERTLSATLAATPGQGLVSSSWARTASTNRSRKLHRAPAGTATDRRSGSTRSRRRSAPAQESPDSSRRFAANDTDPSTGPRRNVKKIVGNVQDRGPAPLKY